MTWFFDSLKKDAPFSASFPYLPHLLLRSQLIQQGHRTNDDTGDEENAQHTVAHDGQHSYQQINTHTLPSNHTPDQRQDQAAGNDGGDLAGNVDADGMHQQEVLVVLLQT